MHPVSEASTHIDGPQIHHLSLGDENGRRLAAAAAASTGVPRSIGRPRRRAATWGPFPEDSVSRLRQAIQTFNCVPAVLSTDESSRAEVSRRFDFVVAQMACAELEAGLVFGASAQTDRVTWKWWQAPDGRDDADGAAPPPDPGDVFDPLRRGQPGTVTLTVRQGTPQVVFALRQLLRFLSPEDIEVRPG